MAQDWELRDGLNGLIIGQMIGGAVFPIVVNVASAPSPQEFFYNLPMVVVGAVFGLLFLIVTVFPYVLAFLGLRRHGLVNIWSFGITGALLGALIAYPIFLVVPPVTSPGMTVLALAISGLLGGLAGYKSMSSEKLRAGTARTTN